MKFGFFAEHAARKVLELPKNHFRNLQNEVAQSQQKSEAADAQKFAQSVAVLTNRKTPGLFVVPTPKPSFGFFPTPKPKSELHKVIDVKSNRALHL